MAIDSMFTEKGNRLLADLVDDVKTIISEQNITLAVTTLIQIVADGEGAGSEVYDTAVRENIFFEIEGVLRERIEKAFNESFAI